MQNYIHVNVRELHGPIHWRARNFRSERFLFYFLAFPASFRFIGRCFRLLTNTRWIIPKRLKRFLKKRVVRKSLFSRLSGEAAASRFRGRDNATRRDVLAFSPRPGLRVGPRLQGSDVSFRVLDGSDFGAGVQSRQRFLGNIVFSAFVSNTFAFFVFSE